MSDNEGNVDDEGEGFGVVGDSSDDAYMYSNKRNIKKMHTQQQQHKLISR